jgi:DNA polymerase III delta subunit
MVYLFVGADSLSKDIQLKKIKQELLPPHAQEFNFDLVHASEATLKKLQEKFLCLPVSSPMRLIVIKEIELLKEDAKDFILAYVAKPYKGLTLVLDAHQYDYKNDFLKKLLTHVRVVRFKEETKVDTFLLARHINARRPDAALRVLNQLIEDGQRPERILGGLRFVFEKEGFATSDSKKRLKLLLQCDSEIKTGKIKPVFAMEKLIVALSGLFRGGPAS